ncbi:hypothetical protein [Candidatus Hydrogenosomobacter endosymbioticus]|uniref:hypothetical protein n=1 Tax=Candidatus Hydrogenosomobacter endosymbioticus TaxID=2558174 RepID=UPI001F24432B|nr:hypothetical protein [Candidatus Hydrogenosomobacter endosymbioticus]
MTGVCARVVERRSSSYSAHGTEFSFRWLGGGEREYLVCRVLFSYIGIESGQFLKTVREFDVLGPPEGRNLAL